MPKDNASSKIDANVPIFPDAYRIEDFASEYANTIRYESTVFDLKLIFGQTDLSETHTGGKEMVEQHTAITIPWPVVKILIYFLALHVFFQEYENGPIVVPKRQLPPELPQPPEEARANPDVVKSFEGAKKLREELLSRLFYVTTVDESDESR